MPARNSLSLVCANERQRIPQGKHWLPLEANPEVMGRFAAQLGYSGADYVFHDVYGLYEV